MFYFQVNQWTGVKVNNLMFPRVQPFPQLLISPVQSEDKDDDVDESIFTDDDHHLNKHNNNSIEIFTDEVATDSGDTGDKHWRSSLDDAESSRKSSLSSRSALSFNVHLPMARTMKVPTFESKMSKLSPIPMAMTPMSGRHGGSSLSVISSLSSRWVASNSRFEFDTTKLFNEYLNETEEQPDIFVVYFIINFTIL